MNDVIIIGGEAGKAAADDDDVIHGDGLRVVDGECVPGALACIFPVLRGIVILEFEYCQVLKLS
jgi:hypothetical protein